MLKYLEKEDFREEVKEGKVLVDFFATWCGPCKMLSPILEELAEQEKDLKIIKVDVDQHEELSRQFGVMSIPTLVLFQDGVAVKKNVGYVPKELLEEWVK